MRVPSKPVKKRVCATTSPCCCHCPVEGLAAESSEFFALLKKQQKGSSLHAGFLPKCWPSHSALLVQEPRSGICVDAGMFVRWLSSTAWSGFKGLPRDILSASCQASVRAPENPRLGPRACCQAQGNSINRPVSVGASPTQSTPF